MEIKIVGIASERVLEQFNSLRMFTSNANVFLFCDYSNYDIPQGVVFNSVFDMQKNKLESGNIKLEKITQEFGFFYEAIPKGHKTICLFELNNINWSLMKDHLDTVNNWFESERYLVFR